MERHIRNAARAISACLQWRTSRLSGLLRWRNGTSPTLGILTRANNEPNENSDQVDQQASAFGDALAHVANETLILARLEEFISPKPAQLAKTDAEANALDAQVDRVIALYGGVPRFFIQGINDPKPKYDTYMSDAIDEAIEVFKRARRSLCRAQSFMIGANLLKVNPEALGLPDDEEYSQLLQTSMESVFWEHTETSFIRLAGYWDRVGQMLDFSFFSIRQYERDGFSAVVDRIRANALKMQPHIEKNPSWKAIWSYKNSEQEDGLKWLLSRRNLLVHSCISELQMIWKKMTYLNPHLTI